jgi:hypoxanthine phosphoribosyltransferase
MPTRVSVDGEITSCVWCGKDVDANCRKTKQSAVCEKCGKNVGDDFCECCEMQKDTSYVQRPIIRGKTQVDFHKNTSLLGPYITWEQFNNDIIDFSDSLKGKGYDAVIGVPRSGLAVATQMSIRLGVPLYSVGEYGPVLLGGGLRVRRRNADEEPKKALLVEDSSNTGFSLKEAEQWLGEAAQLWNVKKAAIYSTESQLANLHEYHRSLELPHFFEWNLIWNDRFMVRRNVGVDFDGILCTDFTTEEDDDGWRYIDAMKNKRCLVPSKTHVYAIITARLQKYRPWTEDWLRKHGIAFDHLIMGDWDTKEEREKDCIASYKAKKCKELGIRFFIESSIHQANIMKEKLDHPILCPALGGSITK